MCLQAELINHRSYSHITQVQNDEFRPRGPHGGSPEPHGAQGMTGWLPHCSHLHACDHRTSPVHALQEGPVSSADFEELVLRLDEIQARPFSPCPDDPAPSWPHRGAGLG